MLDKLAAERKQLREQDGAELEKQKAQLAREISELAGRAPGMIAPGHDITVIVSKTDRLISLTNQDKKRLPRPDTDDHSSCAPWRSAPIGAA